MRSEVIALRSLRDELVASADGLLALALAADEVLFATPTAGATHSAKNRAEQHGAFKH